jgi:hypothetical protein
MASHTAKSGCNVTTTDGANVITIMNTTIGDRSEADRGFSVRAVWQTAEWPVYCGATSLTKDRRIALKSSGPLMCGACPRPFMMIGLPDQMLR